ncbi:MAG: LPXTG cell wall anchor domain-containing protein [Ruminococcus sp.]|nr:LPXTG cell wall anchor domain-containing protein [Ruminococcus sp.]
MSTGLIPEDTVMKVSDISDEEARLTAAGMSGAEPGDIQAIAVDISFIAPDGTELEPDAQVQVNIVLPEEKKLTGEELSLLHVTNEGDVLEMTGADVTSDGASFETDSFSIYILTADNTYTEISQYYIDANKGDQHIYALVGESFTLTYTDAPGGVGGDYHTWVDDPSIVQKGTPSYSGDTTTITFTALKPGTTVINSRTQEPNKITVVVEQPMYVKTAINDRDIDRVNEWLPDVYINQKKNGYIPNVLTDNGHFHPYHINVGDTLTVYSPILAGQNLSLVAQRLNLECEPTGSWGDNSWYDRYTFVSTSDNDLLQVSTAAGPAGTVAASYTATQEGYAQILVVDGTDVIRTMYIQIGNPLGKILDHADIEIADCGKYTSSKIKREVDGTIRKTVTVYKSYVSDVNSCVLYSKDDPTQPCQFYRDPGQPYAESDNVTGYKHENYWTDPRIAPGEPQYELTSKYKKNEAGEYTYWSPIKFYYDDVDHAVFDVQLELEPLQQLSYVKNGNDWVLEGTTDLSSQPRTHIDSSIFYMGHQDVIDAFNKCPNHTGLDFTITAASALIELEVTKTMPGRTLQEGDFTFEVVEKIDEDNYKVISTASNDADGIVSFKGIHFEKAGEYTYYIREVNDGKFDNVVYSDETLEMKVNVHVDQQSGEIFAEIMDPEEMILEINNLRKYTLPETGGTGTVPYTIFGTAMIMTASTLYLRKRRKLSASDSNE